MNSKTLFLITSLILVSLNSFAQKSENYFKIEIEQNGKILKEKNDIILLEKKPFKFKVTLYKVNIIDVSLSWGKYYYDFPKDKNIYECKDDRFFKDCRFVAIKAGNEDKFNEDKDIYVGNESYQCAWFYYENKDWHRFDKGVVVKDEIIYAEITVENIYDMDKRDSGDFEQSEYEYKIDKINQDIYMVFGASHYESGMETPKELQREKFTLRFK